VLIDESCHRYFTRFSKQSTPALNSGSSADTLRFRTPVQDTELKRGIVRTCPRVRAAAFRQTAPYTIWVCMVWVPARSRGERSTVAMLYIYFGVTSRAK
jgi:hypothetical protein